MNPEFVPFSTAKTGGIRPQATPSTKVLTDSQGAVAFVPLSQAGANSPGSPPAPAEPQISLEREGDRVTRIRIQCPCGHTIELACEY
jgi:hypothetical protein